MTTYTERVFYTDSGDEIMVLLFVTEYSNRRIVVIADNDHLTARKFEQAVVAKFGRVSLLSSGGGQHRAEVRNE